MHVTLREARHVDIGHRRGVLHMTALQVWGHVTRGVPRPAIAA